MRNTTIHNLKDRSPQEVFDFLVTKSIEQGEKATRDGCEFYRSEDGTKSCTAGFLLPDSFIADNAADLDNCWLQFAEMGLVPKHHMHLIAAMQGVHDSTRPESWVSEFGDIAKQFDLSADATL